MLYPEQIEGSGSESKQRKRRSKDAGEFQSDTVMYEQVDGCMKRKALEMLNKMGNVMGSYNDGTLTIDETAEKFLGLIKVGKEQKVMFSMPCGTSIYGEKEELSIINYLIRVLYHLRVNDTNVNEDGRRRLGIPWSEISSLVLAGNHVYGEASTLLPSDILEKRDDYLSRLKQVVCSSIEKGKKEDVAVERDNGFFCVECPEESVVTPAKFLSDPEFENLDGALKIGRGDDIIRTKSGRYHDIKGRLKITFKVDDGESIEMILSSENPLGFGKIMVSMNDRSCEIFLKHCGELKEEPRIGKVIEAAESFIQKSKAASPPLSSMSDTNTQHLQSSGQELSTIH